MSSVFRNLAVEDDLAYISTQSDGLYIYNISDPFNPFQVNFIPLPGVVTCNPFVKNDTVYLANDNFGLKIFDFTDPYNPIEIGNFATKDRARSVFKYDKKIFIADGDDGIYILSFDSVLTKIHNQFAVPPITNLSIYPNPFNFETNIKFQVEEYEEIELIIYDIYGNLVFVPAKQYFEKGIYSVTVNRQEEGLKNGVYFCALYASGKLQMTSRFIIVN